MKKKIIIVILTLVILSCSRKDDSKVIDSKEDLAELKFKVVEKGDENAFTDLILRIGNSTSQYEILPYAMIMANKYNSGEGCHQVLLGILSVNNTNKYGYDASLIGKFNDIDKKNVIFYLKKGSILKNENCILSLEEMYRNGWGVKKDILKADSLRKEYKDISK